MHGLIHQGRDRRTLISVAITLPGASPGDVVVKLLSIGGQSLSWSIRQAVAEKSASSSELENESWTPNCRSIGCPAVPPVIYDGPFITCVKPSSLLDSRLPSLYL